MRNERGLSEKKIQDYIVFAIIVLVMLGVSGQSIHAQTNSEMDDPEYWKAQGYVSGGYYDGARSTDNGVNATSVDGGSLVRLGVDVSKYQGDVNWAKAKAQGVEFAIIRVGYRGSNSGTLNEDVYYIRNIEGALAQGIPVGVYFFSQAITESEAVEEANYVLARVGKYDISLPIVIDYEYAGQNGADGRLYTANLSKSQKTAICKAFCKTVQNAGYSAMLYANKSMLCSELNAEEIAKDYCIWLAHYTTATNYTGAYDFWQFTSTGEGAAYGMQSRYVDLDYWYDDGSLYNAVYDGIDYSAVFEPMYYANRYRDLKETYGYDNAKLLAHFVKWGMEEGRQAKATFNVYSYKNHYEDLREAYGEDLEAYYLHYIKWGKDEGRITTGYENIKPDSGSGTGSGTGSDSTDTAEYLSMYDGIDYAAVYNYYYYLENNQDVYEAYGDDEEAVLRHFVKWGMMQARPSSKEFNVRIYREKYEDLQEAYGDDWESYYVHYMKWGKEQGRTASDSNTGSAEVTIYDGIDYSDVYDYAYYIENNPDVYEAYGDDKFAVLRHFVKWGMMQGRLSGTEFNVRIYRQKYPDLQEAYGDDWESYYIHYMKWGKEQGRTAMDSDSTSIKVTTYEGIDYSDVYDYDYYIRNNLDVYEAFGDDKYAVLLHFVKWGMMQGRLSSVEFNVQTYRRRYADLREAYGDDLESYYLHYIKWGKEQGRIAN